MILNIEELARQAGVSKHGLGWTCWEGQLERFAQIIRNQALEDAAKCCEHVTWEGCWKQAATNRANAIRAMKKDQQ